MRIFGINLRRIRISKSLTQSGLADLIDVTPPTVSLYESGKQWPGIDKVEKLAKVLGIDDSELFVDDALITTETAMRVISKALEPLTKKGSKV